MLSQITLFSKSVLLMQLLLLELQRVGKQHRYVVVDSYRTELEKANLLYWQLTCECFYTPKEWEWFFAESGYEGDYSYVFYE